MPLGGAPRFCIFLKKWLQYRLVTKKFFNFALKEIYL